MNKKSILIHYWLVVAGWILAVFYLATLQAEEIPGSVTLFPDYVNHGAASFLLSFLLIVAIQRTWHLPLARTCVIVIGFALVFGLSIELVQQYLTTTRHFSLWDLLADVIGTVMMLLILLALREMGDIGKKIYLLLVGNPDR
jgi:VanZ family protein